LFWKRNQSSLEIFSLESNDRRLYYRVSPSASAAIVFEFGGEKVKVIDISAGGLAFKSKNFKKGDSQLIELLLHPQQEPISIILKINEIDDQNICHCRFIETREDDAETIHQYVLKRQKEIIQSKKEKNKFSTVINC